MIYLFKIKEGFGRLKANLGYLLSLFNLQISTIIQICPC